MDARARHGRNIARNGEAGEPMILKEDDHWKAIIPYGDSEEPMTLKEDGDWKQWHGMEGIQHGME